jgi:hypothetical protein
LLSKRECFWKFLPFSFHYEPPSCPGILDPFLSRTGQKWQVIWQIR